MQAAPNEDYLVSHNTQPDIPAWGVGVQRYFLYPSTLTPSQGQALFLSLSDEQRLAQTSDVVPTPADGKSWVPVTNGTATQATQTQATQTTQTPLPTVTTNYGNDDEIAGFFTA